MILQGKTALISGGSRGIGRAISELFYKEGATLYIMARNAEKLAQAAKEIDVNNEGRVHAIPCDVGSKTSVDEAFARIKADGACIDILVNCAGVNLRGPLETMPIETWDKVIAINLKEGDELIGIKETTGNNNVIIVTKKGKCICFSEKDVREMGRIAGGVRAIKLEGDDEVVAMELVEPGQQLFHREGLGQVVVGAGIQGFDLVGVLAAGADDDDGHVRPAAHPADDLHAVQIGQAQVQQHDVGGAGGSFPQSGFAAVRHQVAVVMGFQGGGHQVADGRIVLHHQDQRFIHAALPPHAAP